MSMVVRNNLSAVNTLNTLNRNHTALAKSLQTVSSGMRINSAKDDTSGYAISERMRVQIRSLNQDNQNTQNGHSMMKVAEGAVQSTVDILKTLKEKVINAANDTNTDSDRAQIQKELNQSIDQINDNANVTYNGKYLVDGSKNAKGGGTFTALTNSSLSKSTVAGTLITKLADREDNNLNIHVGDTIKVSFVKDGTTYAKSHTVTSSTSLAEVLAAAESANPGTFAPADATQAAAKEAIYNTARDTYEGPAPARNGGSKRAASDAYDLYSTYNGLLGALATPFSTLQGQTANATAIGDWNGISLGTDFSNWLDTDTGLEGYANPLSPPASVTTAMGYNPSAGAQSGDRDELKAFQAAWKAYSDAYTALNDEYSANGHKDNATLYSEWQTKKGVAGADEEAMNTAYSNWLATLAPEIKETSLIGTDYFGNNVYTADGENALTITAKDAGIDGQIAGFTICVTDSKGNINKSANAKLDAWEETIRAENTRDEDNSITIQMGTRANQAIKIRLTDMRARALGLQGQDGTTLNVSTQEKANAAINVLDNALKKALDQQTTIGSIESRLGYTSTNLTTAIENVTASESTIRDADMALAMTEYTKNNILAQSSQAMLAQANQSNNQVLSLLR